MTDIESMTNKEVLDFLYRRMDKDRELGKKVLIKVPGDRTIKSKSEMAMEKLRSVSYFITDIETKKKLLAENGINIE
jgi:hypothetical protein